MPLYNINIKDNEPMVDKSHLRRMWSKVIMYGNMFHMEHQVSPRIYVGKEAFEIINQSTSFSFRSPMSRGDYPDYMGHFMGWNVFMSNELIDDEYVIGIDEREVKICKRRLKLERIVNELHNSHTKTLP